MIDLRLLIDYSRQIEILINMNTSSLQLLLIYKLFES